MKGGVYRMLTIMRPCLPQVQDRQRGGEVQSREMRP